MTDRSIEATAELVTMRGGRYQVTGPDNDRSIINTLRRTCGSYEPHVLKLIATLLPENAIALDIGANLGIVTLAMADAAPSGKIYAFEPAQENSMYLQKNIKRNSIKNVTVVSKGVAGENKDTRLIFENNDGGGAHLSGDDKCENGEAIECVSIDNWAEAQKIDRLDLIKMDIEGAEIAALAGAKSTISKFRPSLIVEYNAVALLRYPPRDMSALWSIIRESYPSIYLISEHGFLQKIDDEFQLFEILQDGRGIEDLFCTFIQDPPRLSYSFKDSLYLNTRRLKRMLLDKNCIILKPSYDLTFRQETINAHPNEKIILTVDVHNSGTKPLSSDYRNPINLSYHCINKGGDICIFDGIRTSLPTKIIPGQSKTVKMEIEMPADPGEYTFQISLVQEGTSWLYELNEKLKFNIEAIVAI